MPNCAYCGSWEKVWENFENFLEFIEKSRGRHVNTMKTLWKLGENTLINFNLKNIP